MNVQKVLAVISGLSSVAGGTLWIWAGSILASRPAGVFGSPIYRDSGDLIPWLALGLVLIALGAAGVFAHQSKQVGRSGTVSFVGLLAATSLYLFGHMQRLSLDGGWEPTAPLGFLLSILCLLLFGIATYRARVFPRWVGATILFASVSLFLFNDQYLTAWMAVPFGASWLVVGGVLLGGALKHRFIHVSRAHA